MSEQPERVLRAQVNVEIYNTGTFDEVLTQEGINYREIAKELYAIARKYEKLHRDSRKKPAKKEKGTDDD